MKICILADDFPPRAVGGAGRVAEQVARGYVARGHEVHVITTVRSREEEGEAVHADLTVHTVCSDYAGRWVAYRSLYNPSTVSKIEALFAELKPEVVHVHNIHHHLSYHALKLAKQSGARVLLTAHDCMLFHYGKFVEYIDPLDLSIPAHPDYRISAWKQLRTYKKSYNPFRNRVIRHYLSYCDHLCAVSESLGQALAANGIPQAVVVYNGIDVAEWDTWAAQGASDTAAVPTIAFVGKTSGAKGAPQLLKAFHEVRKSLPETQLLIVGAEEDYTPNARTLAEELGLASAIRCSGRVSGPELVAAYAATTVVAFPSVCLDTFGMVNVEAMATGKPVVSTCFGGSPEVVQDEVTGVIVNPYNTKALSEALLSFLRDPEKAAQCGRAGRARVEKEFTLDRQVEAYLELMRRPKSGAR